MNKLVIFEGKNINIITGEGNEPLFELYGVGQALGYVKIAKGKEYVRTTIFKRRNDLRFHVWSKNK